MIDAIYKEIANKELSFWCKFLDDLWKEYFYDNHIPKWLCRKIIGHPVMIGDVIKYIKSSVQKTDNKIQTMFNESDNNKIILWVISLYTQLNKPIQDQSEECIAYIYSLLPTNTDEH